MSLRNSTHLNIIAAANHLIIYKKKKKNGKKKPTTKNADLTFISLSVIYWPSTEASIKRCTCVSKNSGSKWALENNIIRCPAVEVNWRQDASVRTSLQTEGFAALSDPRLGNPTKMRKKCCYGRGRTWVNIAVRPCLHLFLTHNKHHPFENKVWEIYIFIKKCIRSFVEVVIISWLCSRVYMYTCSCMWLYNISFSVYTFYPFFKKIKTPIIVQATLFTF